MRLPILRRCIIINIRSWISPSFVSYFSSSSPISSTSSHVSLFLPRSSSFIRPQLVYPSSDSQAIVTSFKNWFKTSQNPLYEKIFQILREDCDKRPSYASKDSVHRSLSQLGLKLSEAFVVEVLNYKKSDVLSCLKFFDWVGRQPGFHHTRATFLAIFKILSRSKLTSLMLDLLEAYFKQKHLYRVAFNDILVMGYALAGKVDIALQLFGRMRFNGVDLGDIAYHVLLNALVEERCFDAMNVVLGQIRVRGHENQVTHVVVMKSLCRQNQVKEAEEYLRELVSQKKLVSGYVLSVLVDELCKKDLFVNAGNLINEFDEIGVVPMEKAYGVWIMDLVRAGKLDGALKFFQSKNVMEGYIPEVCRYNFLIHKLLMQNRLQEVCDLLMDMKENEVVPDKVTMNTALCFFCKAGMMDVALELYKLKSEFGFTPNSLVHNYIINNLCGDGSTDEAYRVLKNVMNEGNFPGKRTFSILADALCREGKLDKMKDLVMMALEHNFMPADSTYDNFIRALCRARRVDDGYLIYGELNRLNRVTSEYTYAYLIQGFNNANRGDIAGRLLIEMQEKGYQPTPKLFRAVICSMCEMENPQKQFYQLLELQLSCYGPKKCIFNFFIDGAGHAKRPELAREVYELMQKNDCTPNIESDILMLQCYLKSERIADALNFFDNIHNRRKKGRKLYNTMVVGLCKSGRAEFASAMLKQARKDGISLSLECYEELVKLYCSLKKFDDAIMVINEMEKAGRRISSFIGNVLLLHSLQSKDLYKAWIHSRDVSNETTDSLLLGQLIAAFSGHIKVTSHIEGWEEVIQKCFPINLYSYNMLLRKLSIDHIDGACQLFKQLYQKGYEPNRWTYDILVNGLFKHGRIAEAKRCAEEMLRHGHFPTERTKVII